MRVEELYEWGEVGPHAKPESDPVVIARYYPRLDRSEIGLNV
jgi:hypothetical protein